MFPVLTHRSRPPLAGDAADAADADPIPEWFSHFPNDRQTRKPSAAHTMTRRLRGRRPCVISHRTAHGLEQHSGLQKVHIGHHHPSGRRRLVALSSPPGQPGVQL